MVFDVLAARSRARVHESSSGIHATAHGLDRSRGGKVAVGRGGGGSLINNKLQDGGNGRLIRRLGG